MFIKFKSSTELAQVLENIKGAKPATVIAKTKVEQRKKGNPYHDKVDKIQMSNVFLNFRYKNSVNNKRVKEHKENDFVPMSRKWGHRIGNTCLIQHNNKQYVELGYLTDNKPTVKYVDENLQDFDINLVNEFLFKSNIESIKEHQNLDNPVILRDINIDNIMGIKINKNTYVREGAEDIVGIDLPSKTTKLSRYDSMNYQELAKEYGKGFIGKSRNQLLQQLNNKNQ